MFGLGSQSSILIDLLHVCFVDLNMWIRKCDPDHLWFFQQVFIGYQNACYHVVNVHGLATISHELLMSLRSFFLKLSFLVACVAALLSSGRKWFCVITNKSVFWALHGCMVLHNRFWLPYANKFAVSRYVKRQVLCLCMIKRWITLCPSQGIFRKVCEFSWCKDCILVHPFPCKL